MARLRYISSKKAVAIKLRHDIVVTER